MLLCVIPIILLWSIKIVCSADNATIQANQREICTDIGEREMLAILGFPLEIQYSALMKIYMHYRSKNLKDGSNITCTVADATTDEVKNISVFPRLTSDKVSPMNLAYKIQNVTHNTSVHYRIKCKYSSNSTIIKTDESNCIFYILNVTALSGSTDCNRPAIKERNYSMPRDDSHSLECLGEATLHFRNFPNLTFQWFQHKNGECTPISRDDVTVVASTHQLYFRKTDFHDAGTYSCIAQYKDKNIVIVRQNVCITYRHIPNGKMELKCNAVKVPIDGNGTVTCDVSISLERSLWGRYFWYKVHSNGEVKEVCNNSYSVDESRVRCFEDTSITGDSCYYSKPTEDPAEDVRTITLNIKNMKREDFGKYRLQYRASGNMNDPISSYASIEVDTKRQISTRIAGIAVGVLLVILLLGILSFGFSKRMDILWFYKRHFGPCEERMYPYMAYFIYQYRKEESDSESNRQTKALVENMHIFINKLGGCVFDEQRDVASTRCGGNSILTAQNECHRIVLFLSAEFLTDHWSRFATYTTIEAVIKKEKKVILITMPETVCSMKHMQDEPRRVLEMAMKRNTTIHWNGKVPFSGTFRRRLEFALPKCRQNKPPVKRYLSDSSQAHLMQYGSPETKSIFEMKEVGCDIISEVAESVETN